MTNSVHRSGLFRRLPLWGLLAGVTAWAQPPTARVYTDWLEDPAEARLIDYSYAGYRLGLAEPPEVPGPVFPVTAYGAQPDDGLEDLPAVQKAVDAACQHGGGVVWLPAGTYDFDLPSSPLVNPFVWVWSDHVVVRGAGPGPGGTRILDHTPNDLVDWTTVKVPNFFSFSSVDMHHHLELWYPNSVWDTVSQPLTALGPSPRLSREVTAVNPEKVVPGETYILTQADPDLSLARAMSPGNPAFGSRPSATGLDYKAMKYRQIVRVREIVGQRLLLDNPLAMELRAEWSPTLWPTEHPVLREAGLEDLTLVSQAPQPFVHHQANVSDYGYHQVRFDWVENGWIRRVHSENCSGAVALRDSKNCLVIDCAVRAGEGHNGYGLSGTPSRNLFRRCQGGRQFHTFSIEGGVGNVFLDCSADEPASVDLHGNVFGIYNLVDRLVGGIGAGGGAANQVPPNHGLGFTVWNWQTGLLSPYTGLAQNVFVDVTAYFAFNAPGFIAAGVRSRDGHPVYYTDLTKSRQSADLEEIWGWAETINAGPVAPDSLYLAQLALRREAPLCALLTPGSHQVFRAGDPVPIEVAAQAGALAQVAWIEFVVDDQIVGVDDVAPYTCRWTAGEPGAHHLRAVLHDTLGGTLSSDVQTIVVGTVRRVEDTDPGLVYAGSTSTDPHPTFSGGSARWINGGSATYAFHGTKVFVYTGLVDSWANDCQIYLDEAPQPLAIWTKPNHPASDHLVWESPDLPDGPHTLHLTRHNVGFDLDYLVVVSTGETVANLSPLVSLTAPARNAVFGRGAKITLQAEAFDPDGRIARVEFFAGSTFLGEDPLAPYSWVWEDPPPGTYELMAVAEDELGQRGASVPVTVTVTPAEDGSWGVVLEDQHPDLHFTGDCPVDQHSAFSGGRAVWIRQGRMNFTFQGTRVAVYTAIVESWANDGRITLDGTPRAEWTKPHNRTTPDVLVWDSGPLTDGEHTLQIDPWAVGLDLDYLRVQFTPPVARQLSDWATGHRLSGAAADPLADEDHDGVPLLAEYAWNLDPTHPDPGPLDPTGEAAGLPRFAPVREGSGTCLRAAYLRRRQATDLLYEVCFSDHPETGWEPAGSPGAVEILDEEWERVTVLDPNPLTPARPRFGMVRLRLQP